MIKKIVLVSASVAMLLLSGCSSKEPVVSGTANPNGTSVGTNANGGNTVQTDPNAEIASAVSANATGNSVTDTSAINANANDSKGAVVSIFFDYNQYNIRSDMESPIQNDSALLANKHVKLEGDCDESGSDEYNYALGLKRANSVKTALVEKGLNADSITMVSLGESNPVCVEKTEECMAKNRRVDFKQ